ncbi:MAG: hypothetical protein GXO83_11290 [Chlorobi bacterium]|nr:hypothetical protein [Chlorobiota bacterium]
MLKAKFKIYYTVFLYASILFFVYYLARQDYLQLSKIRFQPWILTGSILLLWSGFFVSTLSWRKALAVHGMHIPPRIAVYSHGISVLGKYLPGKIWVIFGRAFPVTSNNQDLQRATLASLKEQLLYLFLGLLISFIPVVILYPLGYVTLILLITLTLLGLFLFFPGIHKLSVSLLKRIIRKELNFPVITFGQSLQMGRIIMVYWILWSSGFYLFLLSFANNVLWIQAFAFPLSVCYGVMAIIFPGGLGIREGIMTGFLVLTGMPVETATTISVLNRLWFITGELFIFTLAFFLRPKNIDTKTCDQ